MSFFLGFNDSKDVSSDNPVPEVRTLLVVTILRPRGLTLGGRGVPRPTSIFTGFKLEMNGSS